MIARMKSAIFLKSGRINLDEKIVRDSRSVDAFIRNLANPFAVFSAGLVDNRLVANLGHVGKKRMRRLIEVVSSGRMDTHSLVPRRLSLEEIGKAYDSVSSTG